MIKYITQLPTILCFLLAGMVLNAQTRPTNAEERLKGLEKKQLLARQSLVNHIPFKNIGPHIMSGRVVDVEVNPWDPTEFYVAYASGGLWHSVNNGQSFKPVFDNQHTLTIGDIAVFWRKNATPVIWIGTGEVNSSRSSYAGTGIFKSTDSGKTWNWMGLPESHHIGKIQLHPANADIAWVAVLGHLYTPSKERGVYKTTDGGKNWKHTLFIDELTGAIDLDINPQNPNELYAATWYRARAAWKFEESGPSGGIHKSTDGGETWKKISGEGSGFMNGPKIGRIGLAVYPANPQTVFAVVDNNNLRPLKEKKKNDSVYVKDDLKSLTAEQFEQLDNKKLDSFLKENEFPKKYSAKLVKELVKTGKQKPSVLYDYLDVDDGFQNTGIYGCEVYRSDNGGQSWVRTNDTLITTFSTYGYYFGKIYVSPVNDKKLFIAGFNLMMSTDGGKRFKNIDGKNVHPDHHAVWINPQKDSHIINGNDGGLNITYDDGKNWFKANNIPVGQFYAVSTDNALPNYNVYGGLQDNGVWYGSSRAVEDAGWLDNGQNPFKMLNGGDGMQVQVDHRDNKTVYSGSQFGAYNRKHVDSLARGRGSRPLSVQPQHDLGETPLRFNWQSPIALSRHNEDVFYFGANKLYRSLNKGNDMKAISPDLTRGKKAGNVPFGTLTTICESPLRFGLLYTGSDDGLVYVTQDMGYSWTNISRGLPEGLYISRVTASAHKESRVYVTVNGYRNDHFNPYVFVSEDYGATWAHIARDLPTEPVNVIREDPVNENILYIGTDGGLYVSINRGASCMAWNKGLPWSVPVHDIAIQQRENELLLGTHGRSLYIARLNEVQKLLKNEAYRKEKEAAAQKRTEAMIPCPPCDMDK
ncbi:MAG: hypothetical protein JNM68_00560 [Dinghuibacter sp.]|nr:hypothetical protein [Dinghuibacter sp.]